MEASGATFLGPEEVLSRLPQKPPFLFIDRILEISDQRIVAEYRFKEDEYFYRGHFPGEPVTPGVILIEAMAQVGLVALGIYLVGDQRGGSPLRTLFSDCAVEFSLPVFPGTEVKIVGERVFWRRNKLQSRVEMQLRDGSSVAHGVVSGIGVTAI